jgi:hypothetical protein
MNPANVKPQGPYIVWGYFTPRGTDGSREHVCSFRDLSLNISEAINYAKLPGRFAQVVASSGTVVYDTRYPEQRQAERCAVCRNDLDKGPERIEEHGLTFDSVACLVAFEERQAQ